MPKTHRPATVVALMLALFTSAMEMTVVSTAMPTVVGDLGGIHLYAWVFTAYMLAVTVTVPIYGKLADLYGRKPILLFGLALFLVGSVTSGQAQSIEQLIAFRAVQGLGAGAMQPVSMTIVGDLFDLEERAKMQGLFGAVWGLSGIAGPILGGYIVEALSWRWVFYINLPAGLLSMGILTVAYHETFEKKRPQLDVAGSALLTVGMLFLLAGSAGGGGLAPMYFVLAALSLAVFVAVERRAPMPVIPLDLFRRRVMVVATALGALLGGAMIAIITFVPLHVQAVLGGSAQDAGSAITPMVIGWPLSSALAGRLLVRVGFRPLILIGLAVVLGSSVWLAASLSPAMSMTSLRLSTAAFGVGMGFLNTSLLIAVQSSVEWNQRGVATASTIFFRIIGGTLVVGALGGVIARELTSHPGVPADAANALLGPDHGRELSAATIALLAGSLEEGLQTAFWVIAALTLAAAIVGLFFPRLSTAMMTTAVADAEPASHP